MFLVVILMLVSPTRSRAHRAWIGISQGAKKTPTQFQVPCQSLLHLAPVCATKIRKISAVDRRRVRSEAEDEFGASNPAVHRDTTDLR